MIRIFIVVFLLVATGCTKSIIETEALEKMATQNALNSTKEVQLAYLDCYVLQRSDRRSCRIKARHDHKIVHDDSSWEYVRPFNKTVELLGFGAFLRDLSLACERVEESPRYISDLNAYLINCTDGNQHHMRFDRRKRTWEVLG